MAQAGPPGRARGHIGELGDVRPRRVTVRCGRRGPGVRERPPTPSRRPAPGSAYGPGRDGMNDGVSTGTATQERLDLASLGPGFVADPFPVLARLREEEPVRRVVYHGLPAWLVTRFADVQAAYSEPRLSADPANASEEARAVPWTAAAASIGLGRAMVYLDPPEHSRVRRLVSRAFTPRRVDGMRAFIRQTADDLLDGVREIAREHGQVDLLREYSVPLANRVIMGLIGVPVEDSGPFQDYSSLFLSTDPADQARFPEALAWIRAYIDRLVTDKRAAPGDDLLSELIAMHEAGDRLSGTELGSMTLLLLMAGFETTATLIANAVLALLMHPDQLALLRAEPGLVSGAVEETLRYDGPALASLPKYAAEDLTLGGVIIRRDEVGHIGFAHGIHFCLGASLARMEAQIGLAALLDRFPSVRLAVRREDLVWRITPNIRGLKALPLFFDEPAERPAG